MDDIVTRIPHYLIRETVDVGDNAVQISPAPGEAGPVREESIVFSGEQGLVCVVPDHLCAALKFNYYEYFHTMQCSASVFGLNFP